MLIRWKAVPGYPGYEVSDQGEVRSLAPPPTLSKSRRSGKTLTPSLTHGYRYVGLYRDGGKQPTRRIKVSVLVLEAFVGPRPEGMHACHRDDVRVHDTLDNLYWGTKSENEQDKVRNGNHPEARKTECDNGHAFTEANTYLRPDGKGRGCKQCMYDRNKARREAT